MLLLILACGPKSTVPMPVEPVPAAPVLNAEATAGVSDPVLRQLLHDHWEDTLERSPIWASRLGDHRFDDRIGDHSLAGEAASRQARDAFLARAEALSKPVERADQQALGLFIFSLEQSRAGEICQSGHWGLSARDNALVEWSYLPEAHTVSTAQDGRNLLQRYRAIPGAIEADMERLSAGLSEGRVANATSVQKVLEQLADQNAQPIEEWPLYAPITADHAEWSQEELVRYQTGMHTAMEAIVAAFTTYTAFIEQRVLPVAQQRSAEGLTGLVDGSACYEALVGRYTTLPLTAGQIHQIGLDELEKIHDEFREIGGRALKPGGLRDSSGARTRGSLHDHRLLPTAKPRWQQARGVLRQHIRAADPPPTRGGGARLPRGHSRPPSPDRHQPGAA